jgi:16S rRNA (cytosine967-C5)-methyltransferase
MTRERRAQRGPAPKPARQSNSAPPGLAARLLAHRLIAGVLVDRQPLELVLTKEFERSDVAAMEPRDRAFARSLASTVLRRHGQLDLVLGTFMTRPLPDEAARVRICLLTGAAQLLFLETPPHAAVGLAVDAVRRTRNGARYAGMTNAVLRRVAAEGRAILGTRDAASLNVPSWLLERWRATYGDEAAQHIAEASLREAPLDITLKSGVDPAIWVEKLGGIILQTGSVRRPADTRVEDLAGYADGAWWVQDAAAALVAHVAGEVGGRAVADLCAAPGGKTAQLAAAGGLVTAVDMSPKRLERLTENLQRLSLTADVVTADASTWRPARTFDLVVLDAPCTATGTIRRHPDILRLKRAEDVTRLAAQQAAMLANAAHLVGPGGTLVYSTCSLEREEGQDQIAAFLAAHPQFRRDAVEPAHIGGDAGWITPDGDVRTLPCHMKMGSPDLNGMDGFFIARLRRHT